MHLPRRLQDCVPQHSIGSDRCQVPAVLESGFIHATVVVTPLVTGPKCDRELLYMVQLRHRTVQEPVCGSLVTMARGQYLLLSQVVSGPRGALPRHGVLLGDQKCSVEHEYAGTISRATQRHCVSGRQAEADMGVMYGCKPTLFGRPHQCLSWLHYKTSSLKRGPCDPAPPLRFTRPGSLAPFLFFFWPRQ